MILLGLDLETTGLDLAQSEIIEIGAVLWDWPRQKPIKILNELIHAKASIPEEIVAITGIEQRDLEQFGIPLEEGLKKLFEMAASAQYIVAHNGSQFDRLFLEREWASCAPLRLQQEWIDTLTDVPFGSQVTTRKLTYLAAEHGFLNPFSHRAIFDVLSMFKVLSHYDLDEVLKLRASPLRRVVAQVTYDQREQAKGAGFRWDPQNRQWFLEGKECQLQTKNFPFEVVWL